MMMLLGLEITARKMILPSSSQRERMGSPALTANCMRLSPISPCKLKRMFLRLRVALSLTLAGVMSFSPPGYWLRVRARALIDSTERVAVASPCPFKFSSTPKIF